MTKALYFIIFSIIFTSQIMANSRKPVYGVTIDNVKNLKAITTSLEKLPVKPTTRIVFDKHIPAKDYREAVEEISEVSYVMGELLDSYYMKNYSVSEHKSRVIDYVNTLDEIDIWEIGNEINGDWLGSRESVVKKMTDAYKIVKNQGKAAALTLYYNQNCNDNPDFDMFNWVIKNVPQDMRQNLDYVFVSFYEDDCNNYQPDWQAVFDSLHTLFPNSGLGIGECGTKLADYKTHYMKRYYRLNVTTPNYVGGYFWWYFRQDCVPYTRPLWLEFSKILSNNGGIDKNRPLFWNNFAFLKQLDNS